MFTESKAEQGSPEWFEARLGKITASSFNKVVSTKGVRSASLNALINKAVAERITRKIPETFKNEAMERGNELEPEAFEFLNFIHGYDFRKCGFLDCGETQGCSPDGVNDERKIGLELKCPLDHTQVGYLCDNKLPIKYFQQVQGSLALTGFKKWVFCSYSPDLPSLVLEVERDEMFIEKFLKIMKDAGREVLEKEKQINKMREL